MLKKSLLALQIIDWSPSKVFEIKIHVLYTACTFILVSIQTQSIHLFAKNRYAIH